MSYGIFLLVFVIPPMLFFAFRLRDRLTRRLLGIITGLVIAAVVYTTPWDNYLVATRVWYYDPTLVLNITLGYVPVEEYIFFILQTLLTSFFTLWLWRRVYKRDWE